MLFVIGGLVTVGTSDMVTQKPCNTTENINTTTTPTFRAFSYASVSVHDSDCKNDTTSIFVGDLLIFCSQVIVASQMVIEEKFITKYNVPALQAVGWEGTFGFTTLSLLLIPFSFLYVGPSFGHGPRHVLEDAYDAVYQLTHNPLLLLAYFGGISIVDLEVVHYLISRDRHFDCFLQLCRDLRDQGAVGHHQDGVGQRKDPRHLGCQYAHWLATILLPAAHWVLHPAHRNDALQ